MSSTSTKMLQAASGSAPVGAWDISYTYLSDVFKNSTKPDYTSTQTSSHQAYAKGIYVREDGTNLYVAGWAQSNQVSQYTMTVPFSLKINEITHTRKFGPGTNPDYSVEDIFFKPDGTVMYLLGDGDGTRAIYQYSLISPWNIYTWSASYVQYFSLSSSHSVPTGFCFSHDGTHLYVVGSYRDDIDQYSLSTAWDVSTATHVRAQAVGLNPTSISINQDGTLLKVSYDTVITSYSFGTPFDISTLSGLHNTTWETTEVSGFANPQGSGAIYTVNPTTDVIKRYVVGGEKISGLLNKGLYFSPDGSNLYFVGGGEKINRYTLSTPWDITTRVEGAESISSQLQYIYGTHFKPDGTKMYLCGHTMGQYGVTFTGMEEYSLSTAWDVSTAVLSRTKSFAADERIHIGVSFKPDGTKMYLLGSDNDAIKEYTLSSAWNISTASLSHDFSISAQITGPGSLYFKEDGLTVFVGGSIGLVVEYSLSTAWDMSTAVYVQTLDINAKTGVYAYSVTGLSFRDDGTEMYVLPGSVGTIQHIFTFNLGEKPEYT